MNNLKHFAKLGLLRKKNLIATAVRNAAGAWNKDWKPGPYPQTQEERDAAAKKYGLHPKDYQPYPDDGTGFGDYPMFEPISMEARDPYEHYDMPEYKRNWCEVFHVDFDAYTADRVDCNKRYLTPLHMQVVYYIGLITFFYVIFFLNENRKIIKPVMNPQFPGDEKVHYTFEHVQ